MNLKKVIPEPTAVLREGIIVLGGILLAAFVISRFPSLKTWVSDNSVTVKDGDGNTLW
ncbi:hypothetical protein [Massilia timonae]|uniref:hypothetical protein n=1 Tax=Massilia timonae TaxID=47229 RepID=UPI0028D08DCC|nr:hypothetical protein [Massilia timonae]